MNSAMSGTVKAMWPCSGAQMRPFFMAELRASLTPLAVGPISAATCPDGGCSSPVCARAAGNGARGRWFWSTVRENNQIPAEGRVSSSAGGGSTWFLAVQAMRRPATW